MKKEQQRRYRKATKSAHLLTMDLAAAVRKYVEPVESGPRKKVLRRVNPLNLPDDAGASYGSNYGVVS
jgi:hypothetical protein